MGLAIHHFGQPTHVDAAAAAAELCVCAIIILSSSLFSFPSAPLFVPAFILNRRLLAHCLEFLCVSINFQLLTTLIDYFWSRREYNDWN